MGSDERERTMYNVIVLIIIYLMCFILFDRTATGISHCQAAQLYACIRPPLEA